MSKLDLHHGDLHITHGGGHGGGGVPWPLIAGGVAFCVIAGAAIKVIDAFAAVITDLVILGAITGVVALAALYVYARHLNRPVYRPAAGPRPNVVAGVVEDRADGELSPSQAAAIDRRVADAIGFALQEMLRHGDALTGRSELYPASLDKPDQSR